MSAKRFKREQTVHSYVFTPGYEGTRGDRYTHYGSVGTPHGFVRVQAWNATQSYDHRPGYWLRFMHDGRVYYLDNNYQTLTDRGVVTVARRFAADVVAGKYDGEVA